MKLANCCSRLFRSEKPICEGRVLFCQNSHFYFCRFIYGRIDCTSAKRHKEMHINLADDLKKRFHATCVLRGKKMSQVVIELIKQWLEANELPPSGERK